MNLCECLGCNSGVGDSGGVEIHQTCAALADRHRVNRIFDQLGVVYPDCPYPVVDAATAGAGKGSASKMRKKAEVSEKGLPGPRSAVVAGMASQRFRAREEMVR